MVCNAEMVDAADGPDDAEDTDCGRAVDKPATGSDFPGGHKPRAGFFLVAQAVESEVPVGIPLAWTAGAVTVGVEDAEEAMEVDEFVRCAVLRGPEMNILPTSSVLIEERPFGAAPFVVPHPGLEPD